MSGLATIAQGRRGELRRAHETSLNSYVGGKFCKEANEIVYDVELCRLREERWKSFGSKAPTRTYTGECGPDCRPTCVTLLLDLEKIDLGSDLTCQEEEFCQCEFQKNIPCPQHNEDVLFSQYPKCYLEEADCLGPTIYDDKVAFITSQANQNIQLDQCTRVPADERYCRFQDWPLVTPLDMTCKEEDSTCFNDPSKIYFEYCNIIEEELCDDCKDDKCQKRCSKVRSLSNIELDCCSPCCTSYNYRLWHLFHLDGQPLLFLHRFHIRLWG